MSDRSAELHVTDEGVTLPATEVLAGRGFVTGKSGSGKSNTASVVAEELLDRDLPLLLVDTDGEYSSLKEDYEVLHVGRTDDCDAQVGPEHADRLARLALEEHVPIVLDVSGYLHAETAEELIAEVAKALFLREREAQRPFLLLVEEMHEYLPEGRGRNEAGDALVQIAKRGRKRGLGLCGVSQRPAAVAKEFITQCDWLCWHRLTWDNDTKVAGRILGDDAAKAIQELDDGEALLMTDWDEEVRRVQFRRKRTFDAGATPGLEGMDRPQLRSVRSDLVAELQDTTDGADDGTESDQATLETVSVQDTDVVEADGPAVEDDPGRLRERLQRKDARIAQLEGRIEELERRVERGRGRDRGRGKASGADGRSGSRTAGSPPEDPLWEVGQLTAYLFRATGRAFRRAGGRVSGLVGRSSGTTGRRED